MQAKASRTHVGTGPTLSKGSVKEDSLMITADHKHKTA